MKNLTDKSRCGFSLVELSVATSILIIVLAVAFAGFGHVMRGSNLNHNQNELDTQVQVSMEQLKINLRLSSLDKIFYYPSGGGPYTAVSFPMARDDDGDGVVDTDENGDIIWDRTMVYHVWTAEPSQLRRTIFDPRDNTLSEAQRQAQLDSVVINGNGTAAPNSANAKTSVVFENLFTWRISPRSSTYDAYADVTERDINRYLGSCVLSNGMHEFTFRVIGKNGSSSGRKIGLDSLVVSPSYGKREAEAQLPATDVIGPAVAHQEMTGGSWDGNYQLVFPATADNQKFTLNMGNDRWEETNFGRLGFSTEDTSIVYDIYLTPRDYVVQLDGYGYSWYAYRQTGATNEWGYPLTYGMSDPGDSLAGCAVRVVMKGGDMAGGNWIEYNGARSWVHFVAGGATTNEKLRIEEAYIAECTNTASVTPDIDPATLRRLVVYTSNASTFMLQAGQGTWTYDNLGYYPIDRDKTYVVSFRVSSDPGKGHARYWPEVNDPSGIGCFIITNAVAGDVTAANWSTRGDVIATNRLYAIQYLYTSYPSNGVYTSGIYDTHLDSPSYDSISWNAVVPLNCYMGFKVRSAANSDMSDAVSWTNLTAITMPGFISPGSGRYIQFQTEMRPYLPSPFSTPKLRDVTITWDGVESLVDIGGTITRGPDYGIFELKVDGQSLKTGLNIDLEIFKDIPGYRGTRRITSALTAEVVPRNTGR